MPTITTGTAKPKPVKSNIPSGMAPTAVSKANRSPELEATSNDFITRLNEVANSTQGAYQAKQNTFDDVIRSMTNVYGAQAGRQGTAVTSGALASGLTPLEASQLGGNSMEQLLQQFFPQKAQLKTQQADVGVQAAGANRALTGDYGNFIQSVLAPYMKGVAGQENYDILGQNKFDENNRRYEESQLQRDEDILREQEAADSAQNFDWQKLLMNAALQREGMDIDRMGLAQKGDLARMSEAGALERMLMGEMGQTQRTAMGETGANARATEANNARMSEGTANREQQTAMAYLNDLFAQGRMGQEQDFRTSEREAGQGYKSGEAEASREFTGGQNDLSREIQLMIAQATAANKTTQDQELEKIQARASIRAFFTDLASPPDKGRAISRYGEDNVLNKHWWLPTCLESLNPEKVRQAIIKDPIYNRGTTAFGGGGNTSDVQNSVSKLGSNQGK